jgi:hypothetical protein
MEIYCGNNALDSDLVSGKKRGGTPYECFRKGVGMGKNLPSQKGEYKKLYDSRIFCGKVLKDTDKYSRMGFPYECLQKGIGVGKSLSKIEYNNFTSDTPILFSKAKFLAIFIVIFAIFFAIFFVIAFVLLWFLKPKLVKKNDKRNTVKVLLFSLLFSIIISSILTIFFYMFLKIKNNL